MTDNVGYETVLPEEEKVLFYRLAYKYFSAILTLRINMF